LQPGVFVYFQVICFFFFVINRLDWGQLHLLIFLILIKKLLTRATSMWCCLMSNHRLSKSKLEVAHCVLSNDVWHVTNREVIRLDEFSLSPSSFLFILLAKNEYVISFIFFISNLIFILLIVIYFVFNIFNCFFSSISSLSFDFI
jgi:hypothetical protein